mgnify:CR=1 FL=1
MKICIRLPKIHATEKVRMDKSTSPKIFGSKKDYRRKPKHKSNYLD